ncbi:uncharacterized protein LOC132534698 [Erinaceus europaeus]|uniref:Uncharacterized protein LOC132534698 n=1 Tax=Erinaceus europaeus TaxID=9365 RepID=A0ABM3WF03_ERIEU|nr:uncharacterized protein LOC132534698 [Erinaceus europaeus]
MEAQFTANIALPKQFSLETTWRKRMPVALLYKQDHVSPTGDQSLVLVTYVIFHGSSQTWKDGQGQIGSYESYRMECYLVVKDDEAVSFGSSWEDLLGSTLKHSAPAVKLEPCFEKGLRELSAIHWASDLLTSGVLRSCSNTWLQVCRFLSAKFHLSRLTCESLKATSPALTLPPASLPRAPARVSGDSQASEESCCYFRRQWGRENTKAYLRLLALPVTPAWISPPNTNHKPTVSKVYYLLK